MKFSIEFVQQNLTWIEDSITQLTQLSTKYEIKELYYLVGDIIELNNNNQKINYFSTKGHHSFFTTLTISNPTT